MKPTLKTIKKSLMIGAFPIAICASEAVSWWWTNPPAPEEAREVLNYSFPFRSSLAKTSEVSSQVLELLGCTGSLKGWVDTDGEERISVSFFEWDNIKEKGLNQALGHRPEECMGSIGNEVEGYLPDRIATVDGREMVFDVTQFADGDGNPLYIFKLVWVEGMGGLNLLRNGSNSDERRKFKLQSAWTRSFPRHARVLMLGVYGVDGEKEAWELIGDKILGDLSMVRLRD